MKRKIISLLLCTAMLFTVCMAGMTAGAEDSPDVVQAGDSTINVTNKSDNISKATTGKRQTKINVLPTDDKIYMGYCLVKDVLNPAYNDPLRNYASCTTFTLTEGEPIILYMTAKVPDKWYFPTYDDCVLLELTEKGVTMTGASYDWTGVKTKETNNYKVSNYANNFDCIPSNYPISADIRYDSDLIFDWKEGTSLQCGLYKTYSSMATYWQNFNDVTWTSSNNNIISIIEPDYFWIQHPGKTTLTATTSDGKTQSINLTVYVDLTMKLGEERVQIGEKLFQSTSTTGYMEYPTKIQYLTNSSGTYTTMAPVRFLGESIGYKVDYTEETKDIKLTDNVDGHYICMRLGEKTIYSYQVDGTLLASFDLPVPITLIEGSTYAPLRTIAEYSGFHCQFISNQKGDYVILDDYPEGLTGDDYKERISAFEEYYYYP